MERFRRRAPDMLAGLFGISSVVHLVRPAVFEALIPGWLPSPRTVVYLSGAAEVACAVGLVRRWRWAGPASALLLVGVFPGNVQMVVNAARASNGRLTASLVLSSVRLPLQLPLIWAALQAGPVRPAQSTYRAPADQE